jgi:hypothetical protein
MLLKLIYMDYKAKYLKYKTKYLKNKLIGGASSLTIPEFIPEYKSVYTSISEK